MDQQAHQILMIIAYNNQSKSDLVEADDMIASLSKPPQQLVFKTWLRLKLIRWEIEIKRGVKTEINNNEFPLTSTGQYNAP